MPCFPSSYDNLVTTLASPEILVYQTIVNGIIEFEMRTGGDRRNDLAMVGSAGNRSYPYHGNKHSAPKHERMLCHGCNRPGHFIRDCPTTQSRDGYESQPQPNNPPTRRGVVAHDRVTIGIRPRWRVRCLTGSSSSVLRKTERQGRGVIGS